MRESKAGFPHLQSRNIRTSSRKQNWEGTKRLAIIVLHASTGDSSALRLMCLYRGCLLHGCVGVLCTFLFCGGNAHLPAAPPPKLKWIWNLSGTITIWCIWIPSSFIHTHFTEWPLYFLFAEFLCWKRSGGQHY